MSQLIAAICLVFSNQSICVLVLVAHDPHFTNLHDCTLYFIASFFRRSKMEDGFSLPTFHPKAKIILRGDPDFKVNAYQYATSSNNGMYPSTIIYPFELEDIFKTVDHAKSHNIGIAIRTGGHQYCGRKSRNLMIFNNYFLT